MSNYEEATRVPLIVVPPKNNVRYTTNKSADWHIDIKKELQFKLDLCTKQLIFASYESASVCMHPLCMVHYIIFEETG